MAHQASYRVYRPRRFSEVQGQSRTVDTLREAVRQGHLTHAYLFSGPRGTGKTSMARILAKAVNCENRQDDGDPCLVCPSCLAVESGQHLDVIEIDAASNRGIDEIREIKERLTHQTAMSRYKVYIVDEVHMLTSDAFNALLKTLEEPPAHVIFVLATTEVHKLPVTVLSRCQRYEFKRLSVAVIQSRLRYVAEQERVACEPEALEVLAEAADGALRDALSLFDQAVAAEGGVTVETVTRFAGMVGQHQMRQLLMAMASGIKPLVETLAELREAGLDDKLILRDVAREFRDLLVYRTAGPQIFPLYRREGLQVIDQEMPDEVAPSAWIDAADALAEAEARLRGGFPADLAVELALLKVQQKLLGLSSTTSAQAMGPEGSNRVAEGSRPAQVKEERSASKDADREVVPAAREGAVTVTREFQEVLDIVKRERPSTYALLQRASGQVQSEGHVIVRFEFPAHQELMGQSQNREVLDRAIKAVYGEASFYELVAADNMPSASNAPSTPLALVQEIRDWFGEDVPLSGFGQD